MSSATLPERDVPVARAGPVLLCFDGSEGATEAIRSAAGILRGRDAVVLSVAVPAEEEFPFRPVGEIVGKLTRLYREWDEYAEELATSQARRGSELANQAGVTARPLTATGKPAPTILRVAQEQHAAVIVLGSHRWGPISGMLGSVAARVVRESRRPVLIVPGA
jgi:nucleotide-binding universal stress UspA family protein